MVYADDGGVVLGFKAYFLAIAHQSLFYNTTLNLIITEYYKAEEKRKNNKRTCPGSACVCVRQVREFATTTVFRFLYDSAACVPFHVPYAMMGKKVDKKLNVECKHGNMNDILKSFRKMRMNKIMKSNNYQQLCAHNVELQKSKDFRKLLKFLKKHAMKQKAVIKKTKILL